MWWGPSRSQSRSLMYQLVGPVTPDPQHVSVTVSDWNTGVHGGSAVSWLSWAPAGGRGTPACRGHRGCLGTAGLGTGSENSPARPRAWAGREKGRGAAWGLLPRGHRHPGHEVQGLSPRCPRGNTVTYGKGHWGRSPGQPGEPRGHGCIRAAHAPHLCDTTGSGWRRAWGHRSHPRLA